MRTSHIGWLAPRPRQGHDVHAHREGYRSHGTIGADMRYAGIEAGGTKFVCAVGSGPDDLVASTSFLTTAPEETLDRAVAFLQEQQQEGGRFDAIGVACFGPVDLVEGSPTYGHITSTPKAGWQGADVVGRLRAAFAAPIGFDTDVNGAALGEWRWGAGQGCSNLVYVTVGTGIGGGALVGGVPVHGLTHPEMGHVVVRRHPDDSFAGACPFHGACLEGLASGPALAARWGRPAEKLDADLDAAIELEAFYLAQLTTNVTLTLSPQRIVLGGGVGKLPGLLTEIRTRMVDLLNGYVAVPELTDAIDGYLVPPGLDDRAGVLGAIALASRAVV